MVVLLIVFSFGLFAVSLHLWGRLSRVRAEVLELDRRLALPPRLADLVCRGIDQSLLPEAENSGLESLPVTYREPQDRAATVRQLLEELGREARKVTAAEAQDVAKQVYQLQLTLGLPEEAVHALVQDVLAPVDGATYMGRVIERIETVHTGDLVQSRKMWPLEPGSRVRQPLGVVLLDAEGRVISKAKVLCR